ncbi:MAG: ECF transporter S component [Thaumarchaeota archaeon]|nr:ECF transporter S component [Nitrososphaerota archaeon]
MMKERSLKAAGMALSTALVLAATVIINIYVPATRGYFNLGETMIYLVALLFDPLTAAFAGGVGSALADVVLGYTIYAPATLVIKAAEGALASTLVRRLRGRQRGIFALSMGTVAAYFVVILVIGYTLFVGEVELTLSGLLTLKGFIEPTSWILIASAAIATPLYILIRKKGEIGLILISLLSAGSIMILGYYLYEQLILGYYALAEVPVNLGQVVMGIAVAIPTYTLITKYTRRTSQENI